MKGASLGTSGFDAILSALCQPEEEYRRELEAQQEELQIEQNYFYEERQKRLQNNKAIELLESLRRRCPESYAKPPPILDKVAI